MISFSLKSVPVSSGQNAGGIVPFGLNMTINRCLGRAGLARPRLGKPMRNGSEAAEMPSCLMNCRRRSAFMISYFLRFLNAVQCGNRRDLHQQLLHVEIG